LRRQLRGALFWALRKLADTDDARQIAADSTLRGLLAWRPRDLDNLDLGPRSPYPGLGEALPPPAMATNAIFITGRFRSGSTLLWNLFRHMKGFTAYYEPHNERRWFDPATRGDLVDPTHRGVTEYWAEYEGLSELARWYREEWTRRHLYMDEDFWDPDLLRYTRLLIERARGRAVLQCNRIDFRLGWHRRNFPGAKIVHLHRQPRDQWCSALFKPKSFPLDGRVADFAKCDYFYLRNWARDLAQHFPFLDERRVAHPYQLHYYIWKLSYLFGRRHADHSLGFEELVEDPDPHLAALFRVLDIDPAGQDMTALKGLIVKPALGKWKEYAGDDWFRRHEEHCETVLADFLGRAPRRPLPESPAARLNGCVS
jgi:hypothetical protein